MTSEIPQGVRKYRAFLFALISLNFMAIILHGTLAQYVTGLGLLLGLFAGANAVVHSARAIGKNGE